MIKVIQHGAENGERGLNCPDCGNTLYGFFKKEFFNE